MLTRIEPVFYEKVWGTEATEPWYPSNGKKIGEAWFTTEPKLPLLVKFLFTSERLSVQVHPDGPAGIGKTEMWHILRADPGATIALGFKEPISRKRLREASLSGEIEKLLKWVPVKPGETYFTPAGTVHAIGAGIALVEIQQHSDITYRLYDYGRPRELHLDEGAAVSRLGTHPGAAVGVKQPDGWTQLASCNWFRTDALDVTAPAASSPVSGFQFIICATGEGKINGSRIRQGEVWLAATGAQLTLEGDPSMRVIRTYVA